MGIRHAKVLGIVWLLAWVPLVYSLVVSWPPSQVPHYLALADELKVEAEKFDRSTPGGKAAAQVADSVAQIERWKANPGELRELLWRQWAFDLIQIVLSFFGAVLLLAQRRGWVLFGVVVAVWYLSEHYLAPIYGLFVRGASSFADVAGRIEVMAKHPGLLASVLHFDLVVPLLCLWILAFAGLSLVPRRGR